MRSARGEDGPVAQDEAQLCEDGPVLLEHCVQALPPDPHDQRGRGGDPEHVHADDGLARALRAEVDRLAHEAAGPGMAQEAQLRVLHREVRGHEELEVAQLLHRHVVRGGRGRAAVAVAVEADDRGEGHGPLVLGAALVLVRDGLEEGVGGIAQQVLDRRGPVAHDLHARGLRHLCVVGLHAVEGQGPAHEDPIVERPLGEHGPQRGEVVAHERGDDVLLEAALGDEPEDPGVAAKLALELQSEVFGHEADPAEGGAAEKLGARAEHDATLVQVLADVALAHAPLACVHNRQHEAAVLGDDAVEALRRGHALPRLAADDHVHEDAAVPRLAALHLDGRLVHGLLDTPVARLWREQAPALVAHEHAGARDETGILAEARRVEDAAAVGPAAGGQALGEVLPRRGLEGARPDLPS
eukprot:CAMPEP_0204540586 /NCGR_PEP_ID=MMETSP0661-20131031/17591_1 /ASSEMBLY_ACC=CAM_ASM_000606 /TAXON_ID=109239 /ORGANISM="Alexandrium margalefi, Strain AMGDE01CS-322" /LENGTH=412 /DNA_ID=CAMNT_0051547241 /DNA_START=43 /DNA_END=1278 /DNA_ORIENTATION=+